ncbi:hypothetical protein GHK86_02170 [Acidimicrobiaceae bacterium USS-CC1]|uniref:Uncharacterized protein n=1 Tax=Acidiferrimicrobium australe TaxID=2664430 RepID=A0ABW9QQ02_9ACTN|nr:hypothetical protein [Acidiferrimicrobium australe]
MELSLDGGVDVDGCPSACVGPAAAEEDQDLAVTQSGFDETAVDALAAASAWQLRPFGGT